MIQYSSKALSNIERVRKFLEVKNPDAAARAVGTIRTAIKQVECFPKMGKQVDKGGRVREIVVRFGQRGYIVRYRIEPGNTIFVTRVWHGREE